MKYHYKITNFFKKHNIYDEEMFNYFSQNSTMIDYDIEEYRGFVGCWPNINKQNILIGFHVNTPYYKDDKTALITVHELIHAKLCYDKIGYFYKKSITDETLPFLYEKLYLLENYSPELEKYQEYLDSLIDENRVNAYLFALKNRDYLLSKYNYNFKEMQRLTKRLSKKF